MPQQYINASVGFHKYEHSIMAIKFGAQSFYCTRSKKLDFVDLSIPIESAQAIFKNLKQIAKINQSMTGYPSLIENSEVIDEIETQTKTMNELLDACHCMVEKFLPKKAAQKYVYDLDLPFGCFLDKFFDIFEHNLYLSDIVVSYGITDLSEIEIERLDASCAVISAMLHAFAFKGKRVVLGMRRDLTDAIMTAISNALEGDRFDTFFQNYYNADEEEDEVEKIQEQMEKQTETFLSKYLGQSDDLGNAIWN